MQIIIIIYFPGSGQVIPLDFYLFIYFGLYLGNYFSALFQGIFFFHGSKFLDWRKNSNQVYPDVILIWQNDGVIKRISRL